MHAQYNIIHLPEKKRDREENYIFIIFYIYILKSHSNCQVKGNVQGREPCDYILQQEKIPDDSSPHPRPIKVVNPGPVIFYASLNRHAYLALQKLIKSFFHYVIGHAVGFICRVSHDW